MRLLVFLALLVLPIFGQAPLKPLWLKVHQFPTETYGGLNSEALEASELRTLLEPTLTLAGYRITEAAEAESTPDGQVLEVASVDLGTSAGIHGLDLMVRLQHAALAKRDEPDPSALGLTLCALAVPGKLTPASTRRETLQLVGAILSRRLGKTIPPLHLPEAPEVSIPVHRPASTTGPEGRPAPPATELAPGGKVVDFDYSQIQVKAQPPVPPYPTLARQQGVQGTVMIDLTINPEGVPEQALCLQGPKELRTFASAYALDWRFQPAMLNGQPQWARFKLTMPFKLLSGPTRIVTTTQTTIRPRALPGLGYGK